jgi:hypothetical protein
MHQAVLDKCSFPDMAFNERVDISASRADVPICNRAVKYTADMDMVLLIAVNESGFHIASTTTPQSCMKQQRSRAVLAPRSKIHPVSQENQYGTASKSFSPSADKRTKEQDFLRHC